MKEIEPISNVIIINGNVEDEQTVTLLSKYLEGKADIVLSDLAPNVSGLWEMDHLKQIDLTMKAVEITKENPKSKWKCTVQSISRRGNTRIYHLCKKHIFCSPHNKT